MSISYLLLRTRLYAIVGYTLSMPPQTRAQCYKKRKPAERELLTAGVGGVDTLDLFEKCARQSTAKDSINASNPSRILMGLS